MKTLMPKQLGNDERKWYIVDAEGQTLFFHIHPYS